MIAPALLNDNYWTEFKIEPSDIEFIYNLLMEKAEPLPSAVLLRELISHRIEQQKISMQQRTKDKGVYYLPKEQFEKGDHLLFPALDMCTGKVTAVRDGFNPEFENLKVIEVKMDSGEIRSFASNLADHALNTAYEFNEEDPSQKPDAILAAHGDLLKSRLSDALKSHDDLVKIAGSWFPRSLLVDISVGHLNLAEAVLEEANGGPIAIGELMKQIELESDVDDKLLEFSFDLALQDDKRFDEVGPAGETLWFLHDMEPDDVKETPVFLKYTPKEYSHESVQQFLEMFEGNLYDEWETWDSPHLSEKEISISLIYPHWRSGTLPLSNSLKQLFPTAHEAPRVNFTFTDSYTQKKFPGWVVRNQNYICGLTDWYADHEIMPGSLIKVQKGSQPGEILIHYDKSRQNKEWLKTVLIGSDKGIVFAMLKHNINAEFNERMAIAIPDVAAVDEIWSNRIYEKEPINKTILRITRELAKLNPQGQVHAQELYAAVNVVRRCPPGLILAQLLQEPQIAHLGDLYFRFSEKEA
ncbi:MAG: hypothetical protein HPY72_05100 [Anaerolineae bacterium]|jgi:hypothetical protein|nr:hypothetical protein [Anaerolineae bacterium]